MRLVSIAARRARAEDKAIRVLGQAGVGPKLGISVQVYGNAAVPIRHTMRRDNHFYQNERLSLPASSWAIFERFLRSGCACCSSRVEVGNCGGFQPLRRNHGSPDGGGTRQREQLSVGGPPT